MKIGDFQINKNTKFWLYYLDYDQWNYLKEQFSKNKCYLSSYENSNIAKSDIIIIYCKLKFMSGIVSICQTASRMKQNHAIKIFHDEKFNKFCIKLDIIVFFEKPCRLSSLIDNPKEFRKEYVKKKFILGIIPNNIGEIILKSKADSESESEEESSESCSEMNDDIEGKYEGYIPVLMDPCSDFKWGNSNREILKSVIQHYKTCDKCDRVDNNEYAELIETLKKSETKCYDLKNNKNIDKYLNYYHELKNFKFKLKNKAYILRINKHGHIYHRCMLIVF